MSGFPTRTPPSSHDTGGGRDRYGRAGLGFGASRTGVSAGAARAGVGADARASLGLAATGELRRDPVRGAALADPGDERAAPAGAHPPARALLTGRTGPRVRPVQADRLAGPGRPAAGRARPHPSPTDRAARAEGPAVRGPA